MAATYRAHYEVHLLGSGASLVQRGPQIPQSTSRQTSLDAKVHTSPNVPQYGYRDYWGTPVIAFNVDGPHGELLVHGEALVETHAPRSRPPPPGPRWPRRGSGLPSC